MKRVQYLILLITLSWIHTAAQYSADKNYIVSRTYNYNTTNGTDSLVTVQYFDGLGRPIQTVQKGITPQQGDLATFTEYDAAGREWKHHLPVTGLGNGVFVSLTNFSGNSIYNGDSKTYTENTYEPSPLNRITEQTGVGEAWTGKPIKTQYGFNEGNIAYYYMHGSSLVKGSDYGAMELNRTTFIDEDGKSTTEYKNKQGQVIMTRQIATGQNHDTYYVYNDLGQLAYVLPPLAADAGGTPDAINKYGYVYQYDNRGNCIYKKLPGCDAIYMAYDKANRLVQSQDGNQRKKHEWVVNKYDMHGRIVFRGTIKDMETTLFKLLRDNYMYKNTLIVETYQSGTYSKTYFSSAIPLNINYYDDYQFIPDIKLNYQDKSADGYSTQYISSVGGKGAAGLLTGTHVYELSDPTKFTVSAMYYDDKGNVVQTRSTNHLGGYDIVYNELDFTGTPKKTLKEHFKYSTATPIREKYTYSYDHAGRLTKTEHQLDNEPTVVLADMTTPDSYDELGRLQKKRRHDGNDVEEYNYNIRNWTTRIKSGDFVQELFYENPPSGLYQAEPYYNGNVSYNRWTYNNMKCGYRYAYDGLNRLAYGSAYIDNNYLMNNLEEGFTYDKMGNISTLYRARLGGNIDGLTFTYSGNQITKITDRLPTQNIYGLKEYTDKSDFPTEFFYDANGNMIKDFDRDIVFIKYNLLNLPDTIQFRNGNQITNRYDAGGKKLRSQYMTRRVPLAQPLTNEETDVLKWTYTYANFDVTTTDYVDNFEYGGGSKIHTTEGYVTQYPNGGYVAPNYHYYRKDYLGNIREVWLAPFVVYVANNIVNPASTVQRTQYYPSGLPWTEGYNPSTQQRKYNGKEWIEAHGLDEYDSQARMYYPAIMRTTTIDPLAEKYYHISPYAWCGNNPVRFIDPDGREFTDDAWEWVNKLIADVNRRQAANNTKIAEKQSKLDGGGLSARQEKRLNKQIGNLQSKNSSLEGVRGEVATLAASDQVYNVNEISSFSATTTDGVGNSTVTASTSFNTTTNAVDINISSNGGIGLFAHELKHAYQFDQGQMSLGSFGIKSPSYFLYDKQDEYEGYVRQGMFGTTETSLPSRYNSLPSGPIDINNYNYNGMKLSQMNVYELQHLSKRIMKQAFRYNVNGVWRTFHH